MVIFMGQLYRWVEKETRRIVYVGQVAGNSLEAIYNRISAERSQYSWTKEKHYIIQYLSGRLLGRPDFNSNETFALETHFINLFQTGVNGYGYNRNYQITGGTMSFISDDYAAAWEDLPPMPKRIYEDCTVPPYDKTKLARLQDSFIRNGERYLELENIYFYILRDYVNDRIINGKIDVYCNKHLNAINGVQYDGRWYCFCHCMVTNDNSMVRCIDDIPTEPWVFHWTAYLLPYTIRNLIQCKPYLDEIRNKVLKAQSILEKYNPALISNPKAHRFQEIYTDLKASKYEAVEEAFQKALKKYAEEHTAK